LAEVVYKAAFPSDFEAMMKVLEEGHRALLAAGCIPKGKEPCARLCLEEALVNAVRHGNNCDHTREVRLEIVREGENDCRVRIWDEGEGFQPEDIKLPSPDQPGGRGICLIRHFVDEMRFDRVNKCFEMLFRWVA
jgi:anti-sigma regulatory factor (Ser/Thr protein kinase)